MPGDTMIDDQERDGTVAAISAKAEEEVIRPQPLLRIAMVLHEVLEEARRMRREPAVVDHLRRLRESIAAQLRLALSPELFRELMDLVPDVRGASVEELQLAHAEMLGWLEGLFQGTQLAMQLEAARTFHEMARAQASTRSRPESESPEGSYL